MDLSSYQTLTGTTVSSSDTARVTAEIARSRRQLETMLGYTLDPALRNTNFYNELGKTSNDCAYPIVDTDTLDDPDAVVTAYRLYDYDLTDKYWHVDPFTRINAVKLVYIKQGASPNGVTVRTFDDEDIRSVGGRDSWSKYIEYTPAHFWSCRYDHHIQIAVDAVWGFETIPDDLKYVWADMVTFSSDLEKNIKSESILTHSYTKFDKTAPETEASNHAVLARYAGPHGTLSRIRVA